MTLARVDLWGSPIGGVSWDAERGLAFFEFDPDFAHSGIQVAPLTMPLDRAVRSFPALSRDTFHGLPGMLADALPDRFGNAVINAWLAGQGRTAESFDPVERLCYTGRRAMGALEFAPVLGPKATVSERLDIAALVDLATQVLHDRGRLVASLQSGDASDAVRDILRVGTSAGGARAKAVIAWNPATGEVRSGQLEAGDGFSHWLLKFDGVRGNRDRELDDPAGFGRIEYAYHLMAVAAGIEMSECRLLEEGGRSHFVTRRFDRTDSGDKLHMQSLGAIAHLDFNRPGAHSYEEAMLVMRRLQLPTARVEEQFRRMTFNVVARNQDDHVKNIAFLMNRDGAWRLSPAFDVTYAFNPDGDWTNRHQMTINGKRDGFTLSDFTAVAKASSLRRTAPRDVLDQVLTAVRRWPEFAERAGVPEREARAIEACHRLEL